MEKLLLFPAQKRNCRASTALPLLALLLFSAACAPRHTPSLTEAASRYSPVRIAFGVPARPGSLAWSPEGRRLAFIGETLTVYNTESGEYRAISINDPYSVAWASDNALYVLFRDKRGKSMLCSIDGKSYAIRQIPLDQEALTLYPTIDGKGLIILSVTMKRLSFGTAMRTFIVFRNLDTDTSKTVYRSAKTYMIKNPDIALWTAWTHAGPNPLDDAMLVMEHVQPPDVVSYTKVSSLDLATGALSGMSDPTAKRTYLSASWSPDGERIALAGGGRFEVRDRTGRGSVIDWSLPGMYPSWDPVGSRIYCGGYLIDSDGKNREMLIANAAQSVSRWSPDGTKLAVATGDGLLLFRDITASYIPPDKALDKSLSKKLSLLRGLLAEGVVSPQEYNERRNKLLNDEAAGK